MDRFTDRAIKRKPGATNIFCQGFAGVYEKGKIKNSPGGVPGESFYLPMEFKISLIRSRVMLVRLLASPLFFSAYIL